MFDIICRAALSALPSWSPIEDAMSKLPHCRSPSHPKRSRASTVRPEKPWNALIGTAPPSS